MYPIVPGLGKITLIKKLLLTESLELRSRFGITGPCVKAHGLSRDERAEDIGRVQADQLLIQWQGKLHDRITGLSHDRPDCRHRIIVLSLPLDVLRERLQKRSPIGTLPEDRSVRAKTRV